MVAKSLKDTICLDLQMHLASLPYHCLSLLQVAVLMHETPYTYSQTQQSNRERQLISLSTTVSYETQSLRVVLNASQLLAAESGSEEQEHGVLLGWGGDKRALVTAADLLNNPS